MKAWRSALALLILAAIALLSACGATVDVNVQHTDREPAPTYPAETPTTVPTAAEQPVTVATDPPTTAAPAYYEDFAIEGKWKNTGDTTYGQAGRGAIIVFNGVNCNLVSPSDTYAFYKNGSAYQLDCTTYLFSDTLSFSVTVLDQDHIQLHPGSGTVLEFTRVG